MNKPELIETISVKTNLPKKDVETILESFLESVTTTLKAGGEITLTGFGTFLAKMRAARMGVNPQNPTEKISIAAVNVPKFKAGKALKDALKSATVPPAATPVTPPVTSPAAPPVTPDASLTTPIATVTPPPTTI